MRKENYIIAIVLFFLLLNLFIVTLPLKSIPTCLMGCDYYYENGILLDLLKHPTHTWQSSSHTYLGIPNTLPKGVFYLRLLIVKLFSLTPINAWRSVIILSYLYIIIGFLGYYYLFKKLTKNELVSILFSIINIYYVKIPFFKYRDITYSLLPWIILLIMKFFEERELKKEVIYGAILTLLLVFFSHIQAATLFIGYGLLLLYILIVKTDSLIKLKNKEIDRTIIKAGIITIVSIAIILLLGWWSRAIFLYGGDQNSFRYDIFIDLRDSHNYFKYTPIYLKKVFFNVQGINLFIYPFFLAGIILLYKYRDKETIWIAITYLLTTFHYLITTPLFNKPWSPAHIIGVMNTLFITIIALNSIKRIVNKYKKLGLTIILIVLIIITTITQIVEADNKIKQNKFFINGYKPINPMYQELQKELINKNALVLTNNELSFIIHGLTGQQLIAGRQSHFFHYGDFQRQWMDAAIILYGNNTENREKLIHKYIEIAKQNNLTLYLYWDINWITGDYMKTSRGIYPYDPFRFEKNYEKELKENGLKYYKAFAHFEPSATNPDVKKLNILYQYYDLNLTHPWNKDLDKYLHLVWEYKQGDQVVAKLYEIKMFSSK